MVNNIEIHGTVADGVFSSMETLLAAFKGFEGKAIKLMVKRNARKVSDPQRRYYFGVIVPHVMAMFTDCGNVASEDEVHDYLKEHVGKLFKSIATPDGDRKLVLRSLMSLDTHEMFNFINQIWAWSADYGYEIPPPTNKEYEEWLTSFPVTTGG